MPTVQDIHRVYLMVEQAFIMNLNFWCKALESNQHREEYSREHSRQQRKLVESGLTANKAYDQATKLLSEGSKK